MAEGWRLGRIQSAGASAILNDRNEVPADILRELDAEPATADLLHYVTRN